MSLGTLYVVASPIGHLEDLSARAARTLREVGWVAAEDTRRARILLDHVGARPRVVSFHAHSAPARLAMLLDQLGSGADVALISDAGTPTVSDPGIALINAARGRGCPVVPIPGPSAAVAALSGSGLPGDRFLFLGFLPRRGGERTRLLDHIASSPWTVIVYESPARLVRLLTDLMTHCGPTRRAVVARELTKVHEELRTGTLLDLRGYYEEHPPRGEVTVVVAGQTGPPNAVDPEVARARAVELLREGRTRRDAAALLARELRISRNEAYRMVTDL